MVENSFGNSRKLRANNWSERGKWRQSMGFGMVWTDILPNLQGAL